MVHIGILLVCHAVVGGKIAAIAAIAARRQCCTKHWMFFSGLSYVHVWVCTLVCVCVCVQGDKARSTDDLCIKCLTEILKQITQVNSFCLKWKLHCPLHYFFFFFTSTELFVLWVLAIFFRGGYLDFDLLFLFFFFNLVIGVAAWYQTPSTHTHSWLYKCIAYLLFSSSQSE